MKDRDRDRKQFCGTISGMRVEVHCLESGTHPYFHKHYGSNRHRGSLRHASGYPVKGLTGRHMLAVKAVWSSDTILFLGLT